MFAPTNSTSRYKRLTQIISLCIISILSVVSHASGLDSLLNKTGQSPIQDTAFLKVDEAFIFNSEQQDQGIKLSWKIAPDYYLYLERFKFQTTAEGVALGEPNYSQQGKAKEDPYFGLVHVIHDELSVFLPVNLPENVNDAEVMISYQGCAEAGLCYPPKKQTVLYTRSHVDSAISPTSNKSDSQFSQPSEPPISKENNFDDASGVFKFLSDSSLLVIIGIFFLLGLGLTFTPCVFPMIPIITSIIAGQKKPTTSKSFILSLSYVLGMAITYSAAGVVTGLLGASANIQAALQNAYILSFFAGVFVLLAMAMFGLYELQLPAFIRDKLNDTSQKLHGGQLTSVFFIGALSALVVSPCVSAPLAGALLYISTTGDAIIGGTSLFAMGMGMGLPLIIIGVSGSKLLPKAGQWMDTVKHVFGVMLLAVAVWLISRIVSGQISMLLWATLIAITATNMGAFETANTGWKRTFKGLGLIFAFYAALLFIGALSGASNPFQPLEKLTSQNTTSLQATMSKPKFNTIYDLQGLKQEIRLAKDAGKPILVDFYADWCISCVIMENEVFPLAEVKSRLEKFHLVKADMTDNSDKNQQLLSQFGLFGPPSFLFFNPAGEELKELRTVGEIEKNDLIKKLDKALSL